MNTAVPSGAAPGPGPGHAESPGEATVLRMFERSFSILRFEERDLPDVVYTEQLTSAVHLDQRADVEHYLEVADQFCGEALIPADTIRFIERVAREA
jgi:Domain of unknown function (DUF5753)